MAEKIKFGASQVNSLKEFPADISDPDVQAAFKAILRAQEQVTAENELKSQIGPANHASKATGRTIDNVTTTVETGIAFDRTITEWRTILTKECQVYVVNQLYLAKQFDEVHYNYVDQDKAEKILKNNLYAILLYKYFPKITDEVLDRIDEIVRALTRNIKTFLTKISFEDETTHFQGIKMKRVPNSAVAFSNGIFDFQKNEFILKYERIYIPAISNTVILYNNYIVEWNFDFDFEPLPFSIMDFSFSDFINFMKEYDVDSPNYCWELFYNMSHDYQHRSSMARMQHLSELIGYTLIPQFLQYFILLIGSGQNGKNSLFDGCFSCKILPRPVSNSIDAIEKDRFVTESLTSAHHNIFLETSAKTYTDSNMLKALTGSMYQTVECKGVGKYSGIINCKYLFAGNDQSNIKFADTTIGFRRRINLFEVYYSWDPDHHFMRHGDYYRTDFSGDLHEIKNDITNTICYIYLGMYGILSATRGFTRDFKFTYNEWTDAYADIDISIKDYFTDTLLAKDLFSIWGNSKMLDESHQKIAFFDETGRNRIYQTTFAKNNGINGYEVAVRYFQNTSPIITVDPDGNESMIDELNGVTYLSSHDVYVSLVYLRSLLMRNSTFEKTQREFNDMFKRIFSAASYTTCAQREQYVKVRLSGNGIKFVN